MTTKSDWLALSERCEKATGPDREIDGAMADALGISREANIPEAWLGDDELLPFWSASIDAITDLLGEKFPKGSWWLTNHKGEATGSVSRDFLTPYIDCDAATPALALCAAFAKAMAEKAE